MAIFVWALVSVIVFYLLILGVGIWAARKNKSATTSEDVMVAGRNMGVFVGILSTTATWVGGGYINGTVEVVYQGGTAGGLVWCQGPFGYAFSLFFGALLFAKKMRAAGYVTMLDPFNNKFGARMGGLLFIPALLGEMLWSASILASLGATFTVIIGLGYTLSTIISACVCVVYTVIGGLWSVAYTDVVQLFFIFFGLWICAPFAMTWSPLVQNITSTKDQWLGQLQTKDIGMYVDFYLLLILGGIPWQVYFQRVHAAKSAKQAQVLSYWAAGLCFIMCVPSILIGAVASSTDWNGTAFGHAPTADEIKLTLPLVLQDLTPAPVAILGLGVIAAAVMASADSSLLSASSMFARNIYKLLIRPQASEREVLWCMRISIFWVATLATTIGIVVPTVYGLWFLCSDLVYVILFPQLLCVLYFQSSNTYGSLSAYIIGLLLRLLGGEPMVSLPPTIKYPYYDDVNAVQLFPFRTLAMLVSLLTLLVVSWATEWLFLSKRIPMRYDFFGCYKNGPRSYENATAKAKEAHAVELK